MEENDFDAELKAVDDETAEINIKKIQISSQVQSAIALRDGTGRRAGNRELVQLDIRLDKLKLKRQEIMRRFRYFNETVYPHRAGTELPDRGDGLHWLVCIDCGEEWAERDSGVHARGRKKCKGTRE